MPANNSLIVSRRIQLWLLGLILFTLWIFWSLLPSIGIGLTVAAVVYPWYRKAYRFFQVSEKSARAETTFSILITVGIALLCLFALALPFWIIVGNLPEIRHGADLVIEKLDHFQDTEFARNWGIASNWTEYRPTLTKWLQDFGLLALAAVPGMLLAFFVFSCTFYLGIRFGAGVYRRTLFSIEIQTREILQRIVGCSYRTLYAIYVVHLTTVLVTFLISIPLFLMLGYENILLWAVMFAIFQLIPFIGPSALVVLLIAWHAINGDPNMGANLTVLTLYGYFVVCLAPDFILRPWMMGKQSGLNPLVMWLGFFGGIAIIGPSGFVFGPLLLAVLIEGVNIVFERFPDPLLQLERETGRKINPVDGPDDLEKMIEVWRTSQAGQAGQAGPAAAGTARAAQPPLPMVIVRSPDSGRFPAMRADSHSADTMPDIGSIPDARPVEDDTQPLPQRRPATDDDLDDDSPGAGSPEGGRRRPAES
ncbi:MAG: AI-2E family transporter [Planctomycetota bacterium]